MSEQSRTPRRKIRAGGAVIAGALLVPLSALAAVALVGTLAGETEADAAEPSSTTTTATVVPVASVTTTTTVPAEITLEDACSSGADVLLRLEHDETITDLESAALDALREVCAEAGMPIAGPSAPVPVARVVTRSQPATTTAEMPTTTTAPPTIAPTATDDQYETDGQYDDEYDDEYEGEHEDHEEGEHEYEQHYEEEAD